MTLIDDIRESTAIAWSSVRANKLRSGLTTLGVVIGIVTVTMMGTAINGINSAFRKSISSMGADVLYVGRFPWMAFQDWRTFRNRKEFSLADAQQVEQELKSAVAVGAQCDGRGTVVYNRRRAEGVWVNGNTDQSILIRGLALSEGRWFTASDISSARPVCVLGSYLAEGFFPQESPLGKRIRVNDQTYEVIGIIEKQGSFLGAWNQDNQVVIPVTRFQSDQQRQPDYVIAIKAADPAQLQESIEEVRSIVRRIRKVAPGAPDDFAINQQDVFVQFFIAFGGTIGLVGLFITGLSLIVGGIGIMNIMFVSVTERTKEIGIRKALGAKKRSILIQFLIEAATITLGAGLLAIGIAWPATLAINRYTAFAAEMSWWIVAIALTVSVLTGVVAGFIPALRAARMNPVDALRSE
jgi:putative ABC transport system permease protein